MANRQLGTALIGVGNWGYNLLRNLARIPEVDLRWICDLDPRLLTRRRPSANGAAATTDIDNVLADDQVHAVVVATPADRHYEVALAALQAGKHVFVEKPLALRSVDADRLVAEAAGRRRKLMVGHLMRHHPVVEYLKRLTDADGLGTVHYLTAQRVNLGIVRRTENAWWSLAPHDISVMCFFFGGPPVSVSATGKCFLQPGIEDVVFATLTFANGKMGHIHVSWLDPHKIRKFTIVGSQKMAVFNDTEATEKLRIYDKGVHLPQSFPTFAETLQVRTGDILIPKVDTSEPLHRECCRFVRAVLDNEPIGSTGRDGADVVRVLEAGHMSLRHGGRPVNVARTPRNDRPALSEVLA